VKLVIDQGMKVAEVAKDLGVSYPALTTSVKQYRNSSDNAFPWKGKLTPEDEKVRQLKQQVRRLTLERDILKNAMGYFVEIPK
jgi:transposase